MKIKLGELGEGFGWMVTTTEGRLMAYGWDADLKTARNQAEASALFWSTHEYEAD